MRPRIHLSTALILLLIAAGLLFANMHRQDPPLPQRPSGVTMEMYENMLMNRSLREHSTYGWPALAAEQVLVLRDTQSEFAEMDWEVRPRPRGIVINAAVALAILAAAGFALERRGRKRA